MNTTAAIELDHVDHRFSDGSWGLQDICLRIDEGALVVMAGANGSGKTTLLRHCNALLLPSRGEVRVFGQTTRKNVLAIRQQVGMVFQDADSQIVGETVYDDVCFGPENLGLSEEEIEVRTNRAMEAVGLRHLAEQRPHLLSGGEKRRLAIAGVLAMQPRILVFDEPFANLDWDGTRQVLAQIVNLHRQGHTLIVTTHDLEKIVGHAERLVLIQQGRIVGDDAPHHLLKTVEAYGVKEPCASRMGQEVSSWLN
jgi:biotin transport system ATP-binding protein